MNGATRLALVVLAALWTLVAAWELAEHDSVKNAGRDALINRTRDITGTLGTFIQSQRRFGVVSQDRMETALQALVTLNDPVYVEAAQALAQIGRAHV